MDGIRSDKRATARKFSWYGYYSNTCTNFYTRENIQTYTNKEGRKEQKKQKNVNVHQGC